MHCIELAVKKLHFGGLTMALMTVAQVAEFLGVQTVRVERLEREHLLVAKQKDDNGGALFEEEDVKKYQELAKRLGGI